MKKIQFNVMTSPLSDDVIRKNSYNLFPKNVSNVKMGT